MDRDKLFLLDWGKKEKRFDPFYYIPSLVALEEKVLQRTKYRLRDFIEKISSGATPSKKEAEKYYTDGKSGVPFVRVQNLNPSGELSLDDVVYINRDTHEGMLKRSQVQENDLITKITGVGRMAVSSVPPKGFEGNINQHSVCIKTKSREVSEIIAAFLNSDIGEKLASRRATGGTRPALDYPSLRSVPIFFDEKIGELATDFRLKKNDKKKELESLLEKRWYILKTELNINIPEINLRKLANRIFIAKYFEILGNRIDPKKYTSYAKSLFNSINNADFEKVPLSQLITDSVSGNWGKDEVISSEQNKYSKCLVIRATEFDNKYNLNLESHRVKFRYIENKRLISQDIQINDLLLEKSGGSPDQPVGRVSILSTDILKSGNEISFSNFIHKIRLDNSRIIPTYAFYYLKFLHKIGLTDLMQSQTSGIRNLILNEYWKCLVVLPNLKVQEEICNKIEEMTFEALRVKGEIRELSKQFSNQITNLILNL